jgi:hypothetical protein
MYAYPTAGAVAAAPVAPTDAAINRMIELARRANVGFDVVDGRLVMRASRVDRKLWPAVRACLDEIGTAALKTHVERRGLPA